MFLKPILRVVLLAGINAGKGWAATLPLFGPFVLQAINYVEQHVDTILDRILAEMGSLPPAELGALPPEFQNQLQGMGASSPNP